MFRNGLAAALTATALPYGFTLTIWFTGEIVSHVHRPPDVPDAFLFIVGAAAGYGALRLWVGDVSARGAGIGSSHVLRAGAIHLAGIMGAAGIATAAAQASTLTAWGLASFCSTVVYLVTVAVEQAFEVRNRD